MEEEHVEKKLRALRELMPTVNPVDDWPPKEWPKVLVVCPTYDGKDKDTEAYMNLITNLDYPNYDICIADNSERKGGPFFKRLDSWPKGKAGKKTILQTRRCKTTRESIAKSRNQLLKHFKDNNYDYMMSIEFDLLPPKDIIQELMKYGVPVITAMYEIGYDYRATQQADKGKYPLIHLAIREAVKESDGTSVLDFDCPHCGKHTFVRNKTKQLNRKEISYFVDGRVKRVHGCGMGCTLISAPTLKHIESFRVDLKYIYHDDTFFYMDLWNLQIPAFIHTGYNIEHNNDDWQAIDNV